MSKIHGYAQIFTTQMYIDIFKGVMMEHIISTYYENDAKKLQHLSDKVLRKLKLFDVDKDEFYSLADEIFFNAIRSYDGKSDFDGFVYSCLLNKFKSYLTRSNRVKRKADKLAISIDAPIDEGGELTIGDVLKDKRTVETELFDENEETFSPEMMRYLSRLSPLQRKVLHMISIGYKPSEIIEELHINKKMYEDCYQAIHSYRNIEILM